MRSAVRRATSGVGSGWKRSSPLFAWEWIRGTLPLKRLRTEGGDGARGRVDAICAGGDDLQRRPTPRPSSRMRPCDDARREAREVSWCKVGAAPIDEPIPIRTRAARRSGHPLNRGLHEGRRVAWAERTDASCSTFSGATRVALTARRRPEVRVGQGMPRRRGLRAAHPRRL
jgi:hypothetical protein